MIYETLKEEKEQRRDDIKCRKAPRKKLRLYGAGKRQEMNFQPIQQIV